MATATSRIIELTLTPNFMAWMRWGVDEALNALVTNGLEAEREGFPFLADYSADAHLLQLSNAGTTVPQKALLAGFSTRRNGTGEGLKLAMIALVKAGHKVTVYNGAERWMPYLDLSDFFGVTVLKILVSKNSALADGVQICVDGVDGRTWAMVQSNVRFQRQGEHHAGGK